MANKKHKLEEIKWIGPSIRKVLMAAGKETYAGIAGATVDEISAILTDGEIAANLRTPEKIGEMIQEAQRLLAAEEEQAAQTDVDATANHSNPAPEQETHTTTEEAPPEFFVYFQYGRNDMGLKRWRALILPGTGEDEPSKWESRNGAYTVKYEYHRAESKGSWRTLVEQTSTGESTDITGWQPDKWWSWIASKEALSLETTTPNSPDAPATAVTSLPQATGDRPINITRFEIVQPNRNEETVVANVAFTVAPEIETGQTPLHYQVMVFVIDLEKNESYPAGFEIKPFVPGERAITSQISFPMPALGRFQPHGFVLLLSAAGNHHEYRKGTVYTVHPPA